MTEFKLSLGSELRFEDLISVSAAIELFIFSVAAEKAIATIAAQDNLQDNCAIFETLDFVYNFIIILPAYS